MIAIPTQVETLLEVLFFLSVLMSATLLFHAPR